MFHHVNELFSFLSDGLFSSGCIACLPGDYRTKDTRHYYFFSSIFAVFKCLSVGSKCGSFLQPFFLCFLSSLSVPYTI